MSTAGAGAPTHGLPRMVVALVGLAAALLVVAGLRGLAGIIGPVFLAFVLTIATQPVRLAAERRGIPGWVGAVAALLLIYASLIGLTVAMTVSVARFATASVSARSRSRRSSAASTSAGWSTSPATWSAVSSAYSPACSS